MPPIRPLPTLVVNQIAAGEVVERPASVVKELLENAIDAGARRVDVAVEKGGCELVRVVDDGGGIPTGELPLAVASHATSKIAETDDLFRVRTLGFRGEALASIGAVSRLRLRSRVADAQSAAEIEVLGGRVGGVRQCAAPPGTAVEVSQLFYNTPVRRKFLRTTQTEMGHVSEALTRVALAHRELHVSLRHNGRLVFQLPPVGELRERLALLFGAELTEGLIEVDSEDGATRLRGYVAHPSHSRADRRMQYLFLNGRPIQDRALAHALGEAYRGLLLSGRHPIAFLFLEMPPEAADVNVHPTKQEVRFREGQRLYSQLLATLRTRFLSSDLAARLRPATPDRSPDPAELEARQAALRHQVAQWATGELEQRRVAGAPHSGTTGEPVPRVDRNEAGEMRRRGPTPLRAGTGAEVGVPGGGEGTSDTPIAAADGAGPTVAGGQPPVPVRLGGQDAGAQADWRRTDKRIPARALQLHNAYLVVETDEGMLVIDQHALHERILYEQLRHRVLAGRLESQRLLVPEPVDLTPTEAAAAMESRELLARLGLELESFGGDTVLLESYPAMLKMLDPKRVLRDLLALLHQRGRAPERRDLIDEMLHLVACKAAVKAGDPLTPEEIAALLEQRHLADDSHHCPHGRPSMLVFTKADLDRQFKRI